MFTDSSLQKDIMKIVRNENKYLPNGFFEPIDKIYNIETFQ